MTPETLDFKTIMAARRDAMAKSIRRIGVEELEVLLEKVLPDVTHPA